LAGPFCRRRQFRRIEFHTICPDVTLSLLHVSTSPAFTPGARLGIDTLVQDATGVRRPPGNLLDAPPASSRRAPKPSPGRSPRARFPERWRRLAARRETRVPQWTSGAVSPYRP